MGARDLDGYLGDSIEMGDLWSFKEQQSIVVALRCYGKKREETREHRYKQRFTVVVRTNSFHHHVSDLNQVA